MGGMRFSFSLLPMSTPCIRKTASLKWSWCFKYLETSEKNTWFDLATDSFGARSNLTRLTMPPFWADKRSITLALLSSVNEREVVIDAWRSKEKHGVWITRIRMNESYYKIWKKQPQAIMTTPPKRGDARCVSPCKYWSTRVTTTTQRNHRDTEERRWMETIVQPTRSVYPHGIQKMEL